MTKGKAQLGEAEKHPPADTHDEIDQDGIQGRADTQDSARQRKKEAAAIAFDETRWHSSRYFDFVCWEDARLQYARGAPPLAIARNLNVDCSSIYRRRRTEGWKIIEDPAERDRLASLVAEAVRLRRSLIESGTITRARPRTRLPKAAPPFAAPAASHIPSVTTAPAGETVEWISLAHPAQLPPEGAWRTWMLMGGRGAGKTRAGAEWVRGLVEAGVAKRIALVGPTLHDVREVMIEGPSGLCAIGPEAMRPKYEVTRRRLVWPKAGPCAGAVAFAFSAEDPDSLRGPQFDLAWCDEIGAWAKDEQTWNTLAFAMRLGEAPRIVATTTPRPRTLVKRLAARAEAGQGGVIVTRAATRANAANLAPEFVASLEEDYAGTELGRQELDGELIEDLEGALWSRDMIEGARATPSDAETLTRVVVAVDPPAGASGRSDACGIVVAGIRENIVYVLQDATVRGLKPADWAARVISVARTWGAGSVVAESNQGGEMVRDVLANAGSGAARLRVKLRHASKSKRDRAEPVSALYTHGKVRHVRVLKELEDEMCAFGAPGSGVRRARSPDRVDALVWAVDELLAKRARPRAELM